jgi:YaaC-like Protein
MAMQTKPLARPFSGWMSTALTRRPGVGSSGSVDIESEYWTLLHFYSEIRETGLDLIKAYGATEAEAVETYPVFQSFVRQAKAYYDAAKALPSRNSSLLYYYSFMNLAKAGVVVQNPALAKARFDHGLTLPDPLPNDFRAHKGQGDGGDQ